MYSPNELVWESENILHYTYIHYNMTQSVCCKHLSQCTDSFPASTLTYHTHTAKLCMHTITNKTDNCFSISPH